MNFFILEDNSIVQRNHDIEKETFEKIKKLVSLADFLSPWNFTKSIIDGKHEELEEFFNEIEFLIE